MPVILKIESLGFVREAEAIRGRIGWDQSHTVTGRTRGPTGVSTTCFTT